MSMYNVCDSYGQYGFPTRILKVLQEIQMEYLKIDGSENNYDSYLEDRGILVIGPKLIVSEELESYSILKYGNEQ